MRLGYRQDRQISRVACGITTLCVYIMLFIRGKVKGLQICLSEEGDRTGCFPRKCQKEVMNSWKTTVIVQIDIMMETAFLSVISDQSASLCTAFSVVEAAN